MTHQETIYRFRVYRVWNIPSRPTLHNTRDLVYSSRDMGNACEHQLWLKEYYEKTGDNFIVEDHGSDTVVEREVY